MSNCLILDFPQPVRVAKATGITQYAVLVGCSNGDYILRVFDRPENAIMCADDTFNKFDEVARTVSQQYRSCMPIDVGHPHEAIHIVVMCDGVPERVLLRYDASEIKILRDMQNELRDKITHS